MAGTGAARQNCQMIAAINLHERNAREKCDQERAKLATDQPEAAGATGTSRGTAETQANPSETTRHEQGNENEKTPDFLSDITSESYDPQTRSTFFTKLPPEVRMEIYYLIFLQYEAISRAYPEDAFYYRPGCTAPKCIDTAFLYTCRRAIYEARYIPLQSAIHELWGCTSSPEHFVLFRNSIHGPRGLTEQHLPHMRDFHMYGSYGDIFILSVCLSAWTQPSSPVRCYPRRVTITIPYTGWREWANGKAPRIPEWYENSFSENKWPETLKEIRLRFETMEVFAEQLDELVSILRTKKIRLRDRVSRSPRPKSKFLSAEEIPPTISRWTGPHSKALKNRWRTTIHLGPDPMNVTEIRYYVVEASWKVA